MNNFLTGPVRIQVRNNRNKSRDSPPCQRNKSIVTTFGTKFVCTFNVLVTSNNFIRALTFTPYIISLMVVVHGLG